MITQETLDFLSDLRENNHRDWFQTHKPRYEMAHTNMIEFAQQLYDAMLQHDHLVESTGKKALQRIYRDVRFSKDKSTSKVVFVGRLILRKTTLEVVSVGLLLHWEAAIISISHQERLLLLLAFGVPTAKTWNSSEAILQPNLTGYGTSSSKKAFGIISKYWKVSRWRLLPRGMQKIMQPSTCWGISSFCCWSRLPTLRYSAPALQKRYQTLSARPGHFSTIWVKYSPLISTASHW